MTALAALGVVLASAVAMELVACLTHRYLMHGPLWAWHRSHHEPRAAEDGHGPFERNDLFALVFALLAIALMVLGGWLQRPVLGWVGAGMTLYGAVYTVVHDGLVHRRGFWPRRWSAPRRGWLARLVQAHRLHHAVRGRDGAVSFGFLHAAPPARLARQLREQGPARRRGGPGGAAAIGQPALAMAPSPSPSPSLPLPLTTTTVRPPAALGLILALLIALAWAAVLGMALSSRWDSPAARAWLLPVLAGLGWLQVGLFIVAHDAMHGSLAPAHPRLNRAAGRLALALYAGFAFDRFARAHQDHHRHPGSPLDPDFHPADPRFLPWYLAFMRRYFGWREAFGLLAGGALLALASSPLKAALFWWLPALFASLQLFTFGTWLPHRPGAARAEPLDDGHRSRSLHLPWALSLLTCFHFGYHLEHHQQPGAPWWRLPSLHRRRSRARDDAGASPPPAALT